MYGKHFERMYRGSMMGAGPDVFAVWGYAISHAQKDSIVELNPELMAVLIGMPKERVEKAMEFLMSPDPKSRNPDHEGRRMIRQGQYEFLLTTASYYRGIQSPEDLREYNRIKQRESRARRSGQAPIGVSAKGDLHVGEGPDNEDCLKWLADVQKNGADYTEKEMRSAWLSLNASGWMWGKNPVTDWRSAIESRIQQLRKPSDKKSRKGPNI